MPSVRNEHNFTKRHTNVVKGVACLLLLLHHLTYGSKMEAAYIPLIMIGGESLATKISLMPKVCVSIFLLLSGYGVRASQQRCVADGDLRASFRMSCSRLWKLWVSYIVIFVLFVPWQPLIKTNPYGSAWDVIFDVLGLSYLFGTNSMNATWWYMSVAIVCYLITPFLIWLRRHGIECLLALAGICFALFLLFGHIFWSFFYIVGFVVYEWNVFDRVQKWSDDNPKRAGFLMLCMLVPAMLVQYSYPNAMDLFLAAVVILVCFLYISRIRILSSVLEFIGKHSGNVFFFHSFFLASFFRPYTHGLRYIPLIYITFTLGCVGISVLIETLKRGLGIQKVCDKFSNFISTKQRGMKNGSEID